MRPHRAVQNFCASQLRDAGASVDLERVVPALHRWGPARSATSARVRRERGAPAEGTQAAASTGPDAGSEVRAEQAEECEEAVLDVVACWPGQCAQHCIDVTIRCPYGVRYERTGVAAGVASRTSEKEKKARYGPTVLPLAYETLGRLGLESQHALQQLAQQARCFASDAVGRGKRLVSAWRREQERALLWAEADVVLVSLGAQDHLRVWSRGRRPPQPPADEGAERCGPGQQRTASSRGLPQSDALQHGGAEAGGSALAEAEEDGAEMEGDEGLGDSLHEEDVFDFGFGLSAPDSVPGPAGAPRGAPALS